MFTFDRLALSRRFGLIVPILGWALWWGILTGFLEIANWHIRDSFARFRLLLGPYNLWLAPAVEVVLFLSVGLFWAGLACIFPKDQIVCLAIASYVSLTVVCLALQYPQIHLLAVLLLAGGTGLASLRHFCARLSQWHELVRKTLPILGAGWLIWLLAFPLWWKYEKSTALGRLPPAPPGSPNVVLIVWDTVRAKSLSTYGYSRETSPNLTQLAEEGILFEFAIAPSSWTLPSHASMFTGLPAEAFPTVWGDYLPEEAETLAEVLADHGYTTAGFVANQIFCSRIHGLNQGFIEYSDFDELSTEWLLSISLGRRAVCSPRLQRIFGVQNYWGRKSAEKITQDFLRWLNKEARQPFFVFLNFFDAHQPYFAPPPFAERFGPKSLRKGIEYDLQLRYATVVNPESLTPTQRQGEQDAYDGAIAYLDACLGQLLDQLRRKGLLDRTVIIVTSDHGEHFGEHGLRDHGNSLYRALLHVPLVIRLPGGEHGGSHVCQPVSLVDLAATVCDLAGLPGKMPGKSLRRFWEVPPERHQEDCGRKEAVYAALRPLVPPLVGQIHLDAVIYDRYWFIRSPEGKEELFDWQADPNEENNLANLPGMVPVIEKLRQLLLEKGTTGKEGITGPLPFREPSELVLRVEHDHPENNSPAEPPQENPISP